MDVFLFCLIIVCLFIVFCVPGRKWIKDIEINGIEFEKMRYSCNDRDTISIIGFIKKNTEIEGYPCKKGWVHFTKQWKLKLFCLSESAIVENIPVPKGSWIIFTATNHYTTVVFPNNTFIQGFPVRGGGGVKGIRTRFDQTGKLVSFFPSKDFVRNNIQYKKSLIHPVIIAADGKLFQE